MPTVEQFAGLNNVMIVRKKPAPDPIGIRSWLISDISIPHHGNGNQEFSHE
jgi:hypothetical protein